MSLRTGWTPPPSPGDVAVVTGASSGIGAELARGLARRGHAVLLVARRADRLAELADELSAGGATAWAFPGDLTDPAARDRLAGEVEAHGRSVAVLVNNAGAAVPGHVVTVPVDRQLGVVRLTVEATVDLCGRFVPAMVARRRGAVLDVCSMSSVVPWPAMAAYAAAKAAALSFTEALHTELRPHGVAVTAVCPGFVRTDFIDTAGLAAAARHAPAWVFDHPGPVAEHALRALDRNRRVAVHTVRYRAATAVLRPLPNGPLLVALDRWSPFRRDGAVARGDGTVSVVSAGRRRAP